MSTLTTESVLQLIDQLAPPEQARLDRLLAQRTTAPPEAVPAVPTESAPAEKRLKPIPMPDFTPTRRWLAAHRRDYANQWVALDGDRLIAASPQHEVVWAAAEADGAYLPLVTFIEDPDNITHIIWV